MKKILLAMIVLQILTACGEKRRERKARAADTTISHFKAKTEAELKQYNLAVNVAIWGIPIVSYYSMRQAAFRAGAKYGDFVYWSKSLDWKAQIPTHAVPIRLAICNFNLSHGAVVLEIPPSEGAGLFGSILNAWQVPQADIGPTGEDQGKGGKYLLLPPGHQGETPQGYLPVRFNTLNGFIVMRVVPDDASAAASERAVSFIKKTRVYPLFRAISPPEMRYIDVSGKLFDGLVRYDASFYQLLSAALNEELVQPRDTAMMQDLRKLGIVWGRPFQLTEQSKLLLTNAARETRARVMRRAMSEGPLQYLNKHWRLPSSIGIQTRFTFEIGGTLDIGARGVAYFIAYGPPKRLGRATAYMATFEDAAGNRLIGQHFYHLRVPPKVPAEQFWGLVVYDAMTASFFRTSPRLAVHSYNEKVVKNEDGSVDVWFGPQAPEGKLNNWIYTPANRYWYAVLRFYGPLKPLVDKNWIINDIEKID